MQRGRLPTSPVPGPLGAAHCPRTLTGTACRRRTAPRPAQRHPSQQAALHRPGDRAVGPTAIACPASRAGWPTPLAQLPDHPRPAGTRRCRTARPAEPRGTPWLPAESEAGTSSPACSEPGLPPAAASRAATVRRAVFPSGGGAIACGRIAAPLDALRCGPVRLAENAPLPVKDRGRAGCPAPIRDSPREITHRRGST